MADEAADILGTTPLAASQVNYAVQNEFNDAITSVTQESLGVDLSDDVALTGTQFLAAFIYRCSGNASYRTLTVPAQKRTFAVQNDGSAVLGVVCGGDTVLLWPGYAMLLMVDASTLPHGLSVVATKQPPISAVEDHTLSQPPSSSPLNAAGTAYIVASGSPQGAWAGQVGNIAVHVGEGGYEFETPFDGQVVRSKNLSASPAVSTVLIYNGDAGSWDAL